MRIIFFFSSLIQSLIIVSLVLFLIYGQPEKSAEEKRVEKLEQGFNNLSKSHIDLKREKAQLVTQLAAGKAEKAALEKEMEKQKTEANKTENQLQNKIKGLESSMRMMQMRMSAAAAAPAFPPPSFNTFKNRDEVNKLQSTIKQRESLIQLINSNFTQMVGYLRQERDNALRDRDFQLEEAIKLRRENRFLTEQLDTYKRKCKEDFVQSLNGIKEVTSTFLDKIKNLFPHSLTFHLTCEGQRAQLDKIKSSCTNLSSDVESKFQLYLNNVGDKVVQIQDLSSQLEVDNKFLKLEVQQCEQKYNDAVAKAANNLEVKQNAHDDQVEKLLVEQKRLREQYELQEGRLALKDKEIQTLKGMQPNKAVPSNSGFPQTVPQQGRPAATNLFFGGNTSSSKPPMVG